MNQDFKELLNTFNDHAIKYLIVGGYAVMKYTEPRLYARVKFNEENNHICFNRALLFGNFIRRISCLFDV